MASSGVKGDYFIVYPNGLPYSQAQGIGFVFLFFLHALKGKPGISTVSVFVVYAVRSNTDRSFAIPHLQKKHGEVFRDVSSQKTSRGSEKAGVVSR